MPTPDANTQWFRIAEEKSRRAVWAWVTPYGVACALLVAILAYAIMDGNVALSYVVGTGIILGTIAMALAQLESLRRIREANQSLGVEDRGLWWYEGGESEFFTWQQLRAMQFTTVRTWRGAIKWTTLHLHPVKPPRPTTLAARLTDMAGRHSLEVTRLPVFNGQPLPDPKLPNRIAGAIHRIQPVLLLPPG